MAQTFNLSIKIPAKSSLESLKKLNALAKIAENISAENLELLAEKSTSIGINQKIQMFKSYI